MLFKKREEKVKADVVTSLLKEVDELKREMRLVFQRLEDRTEKNHEEVLNYIYSLSTLIENLENRLTRVEQSLKSSDEIFSEKMSKIDKKLDDIVSLININAESQAKMLNTILKRFTSLIGVVSDILRKQLTAANQKLKEILEKEEEVVEEKTNF
ncbi:MAG TPA: hypothetical protein ENG45_01985 [Candidatus Aenigmarchaeota archaeon]|nr:hypothetical protein [Candidatus Aenigmarchaeota archaeon]